MVGCTLGEEGNIRHITKGLIIQLNNLMRVHLEGKVLLGKSHPLAWLIGWGGSSVLIGLLLGLLR